VHAITNDLSEYASISLTADSNALTAVVSDLNSRIWTMPGTSSRSVRQLTDNKFDGIKGLSWTPDGRIIYTSRASGNQELWMMNANGTGQKQLTNDGGNNIAPCVSDDGRFVVFVSDRTGNRHIWRIDIDGSNPKQLTNGALELVPQCSSIEQSVVYWTPMSIWKISIDGEEPLKIIDNAGLRAISPDGKWIAADHSPRGVPEIAIYPSAGGEARKLLRSVDENICWTPDGRALAYVDSTNFANITSQPIDGGPPVQLTDFTSERIFSFAWSHDGKQLAVARGTVTNDVVLIRDFLGQF
jgi:TolB protein